jgi:hypothetical protein
VFGTPFELRLPDGSSDDEDDPNIEVDMRGFEGLLFEAAEVESQVREPGEDVTGVV